MGRTKVPMSKASGSKAPVSRRDKRKRPNYEPTFYNDQAKKFFNDHLKDREGVRERGITAQYSGIVNIVQRRGWQRFAEQPEAAVLNVVREFYANARMQYRDDIHSRKVLVRGQDVSYDRSTINSFYGLQDYEQDEYSVWLEEGPNCDEVIARLTFENSQWKMYNGHPVSFPRGQLKFISRGWHYFISAKLLPSNHVSDVNKDRALLNFAIQSRMTIDVGKIIEASILSCSQGRTTLHLVHPSLIYQLCVAAGVGSVDEEVQMPLPPINDYTMEILEKTSKASRKSRAVSPVADTAPPVHEEPISTVGPDSERPIPTTPAPDRTTSATPHSERPSTSQEPTLRSIQMQLNELQKGQKKMKRKLTYLMDFGLAMGRLMYKANMFKGVTGVNLPERPSDSSSDSEEDESEEEVEKDAEGRREERPENVGSGHQEEDTHVEASGGRVDIPEDVGRDRLAGDSHDEDSGGLPENEESGDQAHDEDRPSSGNEEENTDENNNDDEEGSDSQDGAATRQHVQEDSLLMSHSFIHRGQCMVQVWGC